MHGLKVKTNEYLGKQVLDQNTTIDHLVKLRIIMEENLLQGKTLYCCFVNFKKAFDTIPRSEF